MKIEELHEYTRRWTPRAKKAARIRKLEAELHKAIIAAAIAEHHVLVASLRRYTFHQQHKLYKQGKLTAREYLYFMHKQQANRLSWR